MRIKTFLLEKKPLKKQVLDASNPVRKITYDKNKNKVLIEELPNVEFPLKEFANQLEWFFKGEEKYGAPAIGKRSSRTNYFMDVAMDYIKSTTINVYVICTDSGDVKSCILLPNKIHENVPKDAFPIRLLFTDPKYQKQGLGIQMLKFAENTAIGKSKKRLLIRVFKDNEPGKSLYKKYGFALSEEDPAFSKANKIEISNESFKCVIEL